MSDTLYIRFLNLVAKDPEATAVIWKSQVYLRRHLKNALSGLIKKIESTPNPSVAFWGGNHPLALLLPIACSATGKTYLPFSPLSTEQSVFAMAKRRDALLVSPGLTPEWDSHFSDWTNDEATLPNPVNNPSPFLIGFQTSGTTDRPKRVLLPESHILANIDEAIRAQELHQADRILLVLSLCHSGGLCIQALPGLLSGAKLTLHSSFQVSDFWREFEKPVSLEAGPPSTTLIVPSYLRRLLKSENSDIGSLSTARFIGIGSAAVSADLLAPFLKAGTDFLNIYGLTEAGPVLACHPINSKNFNPDRDPPIGQIGPEIEWKIDPATSELFVRGRAVQASYEEDGHPTTSLDLEKWFHTRDLVDVQNGILSFQGRRSATYNIGGMKVHGERIEGIIESLPGVAACLVKTRVHKAFGEILVAVIEREPSSEITSGRDFLSRLRAHQTFLAEHEVPREIEFVNSLTRSSIGKKIRRTDS